MSMIQMWVLELEDCPATKSHPTHLLGAIENASYTLIEII
jgi:hypothetical protein